jgi:hypothetical protein
MRANGRTDGQTAGWTDGWSDITKLIVPFRNFVNVPKKLTKCKLFSIQEKLELINKADTTSHGPCKKKSHFCVNFKRQLYQTGTEYSIFK